MRLRWLALYPLLYAAAFLGIAGWLADGGGDVGAFVVGQRILVRVLAVVGCFAAVSVFEAGDRLRRAWSWLGAGTLLILTRDVLRLFPAFEESAGPIPFLTGLAILSNLALLAGIWLLARSWRMVAIEMPGGRLGVALIAAITAVVALAVAGPGALHDAREVASGNWSDVVLLVSALVDIVTLCLITPLLLTAVALRGGLFSWPWGLITASRLSWLLYDAAAALASTPPGLPLTDLCRGLAQNFLCAAGLAQFLVVRHVRRMARGTPVG